MNTTLFRALVGLVPAGSLLADSVVLFFKEKSGWSLLQLVGGACLMVVVLTHVAEAVRLFPSMGWGLAHSAGHYLDLWSAIFGVTLLPIGYLFHALKKSVQRLKFLPQRDPQGRGLKGPAHARAFFGETLPILLLFRLARMLHAVLKQPL